MHGRRPVHRPRVRRGAAGVRDDGLPAREGVPRLELCLESKSLKLYLATYRNEGAFCEALAVKIRDEVAEALQLDASRVTVTLEQKLAAGSRSRRRPELLSELGDLLLERTNALLE